MESFSKIARKNMLVRHNDTGKVVGSQLALAMESKYPGFYQGYRVTDCITFVWRVLNETYTQLGRPDIPKALLNVARVKRHGRLTKDLYGDLLAKALVDLYGWTAIYLTPDQNRPRDGIHDHIKNARSVQKHCIHASIPVKYFVFDYGPTSRNNKNFASFTLGEETNFNEIGMKSLMTIPFGFGLSSKGIHTWLFSEGKVFEVHWADQSPYVHEVHWLSGFEWNSNLLVVPPDGMRTANVRGLTLCN